MKKEARRMEQARKQRLQTREELGIVPIPEFSRGEQLLWKGVAFQLTKTTKKSLHISPMKKGQYRVV
ncbi:MAG: hypothetical protein ABID61_02535 [Candidatus Micrarchaeota archaeon]